jgi:hypothetical protein
MENKKYNLESEKKRIKNIDMLKEDNKYEKLSIIKIIKSSAKFLKINIKEKWQKNKIPLLKRQFGFNKSDL